jgi:ABC-type dipeptide/oligopeptide/nickel transport system permease subunit
LVARTRSSRPPRGGNAPAAASVVLGLLAVLAIPAGVVLSYYSATVTLIESSSSAGLAIIFGLYSIVLSRRGRDVFARTIGRSGGDRAARAGKLLGVLGLCMGITAGLSVGFYGLLILFVKS